MVWPLIQRMHRCRVGAAFGAVALVLTAAPAAALSIDDARHLLTRTGFGAAPHELRAMLPLTRKQAVERLLASLDAPAAAAPAPAFLGQPIDEYAVRLGVDPVPPSMAGLVNAAGDVKPSDYEKLTQLGLQEMEQLRVWWLDRMVSTPAPFAERLALLWHGHFTSKYFDVLGPRLMYDQLLTIHTHGKRDYAALLHAMLRDPAMLVFLDNAFNTRAKPNENLAREVLELFTLGVGHYTEADVKALARAMSGHGVDFSGSWRYAVNAAELDDAPKRFLGHNGVRTLADAESAILANPQTARHIAAKFFHEFVSDQAQATEIERLAGVLRSHRYVLRPFLRELLLGEAFWRKANRGALVKSPVDLLVGTVRIFGLPMPELGRLAQDARVMGQDLFEPPTVKGWDGGMAWLNMATLKQRSEALAALWHCGSTTAGAPGGGDLLVRFGGERQGSTPVRLRVRVDGRDVASAQAGCPNQITAQGAGESVLKPAWELLRVPRAQLGSDPRKVEIMFDRAPDERATLFVNWIEIDGRRLSATLAEQYYEPGGQCTGQEPKGMVYCTGRMSFDLAAIEQAQRGVDPTLYDRSHGRFGAVIETGTARMPLLRDPAARGAAAQLQREWAGLPLRQALLPVQPMSSGTAAPSGLQARVEQLMRDPTFNLK